MTDTLHAHAIAVEAADVEAVPTGHFRVADRAGCEGAFKPDIALRRERARAPGAGGLRDGRECGVAPERPVAILDRGATRCDDMAASTPDQDRSPAPRTLADTLRI